VSAIRVGVIGAGSLGFHHARILREVPGAEMAGIYDADAARAASVSSELGVRAFPTRDALLEAVDAAVVAVPTTAHA
jgi:predicted dehydrogenase